MKLAILAVEGCMHSAIAGVADILLLANHVMQQSGAKPRFSWQTLSLDGRPVRAGGGQMIAVDGATDSARASMRSSSLAISSITSRRRGCNRNMPGPAPGSGSSTPTAG
ncbi:hypothetical protein ML401_14290 [Bradyrhizobium sp. 62B]|uniref:hypothetical protein n=1 Tax=Bradyrhizobium sp. 62B TaxID=2898442 RepID=UPI0025580ABE|nr:hypothetical protein ML401_14290 [Bradyrhizobium sp. 62B]